MDSKLNANRKQDKKGIKAKINAWLEHMAEINEKEMRHGGLSCCGLNKSCHVAHK